VSHHRQSDLQSRISALEAYNKRRAERAVAATLPITGPSFLEKVGHFATSAVKHVAAGAPRCTDEQVAARHAICSACEYFDGKACKKCGCPVSRERTYISKLSWAGESCPVGKWGPENSG
jgi:hypothetical protein